MKVTMLRKTVYMRQGPLGEETTIALRVKNVCFSTANSLFEIHFSAEYGDAHL